mgnify:CR=1 FL=1
MIWFLPFCCKIQVDVLALDKNPRLILIFTSFPKYTIHIVLNSLFATFFGIFFFLCSLKSIEVSIFLSLKFVFCHQFLQSLLEVMILSFIRILRKDQNLVSFYSLQFVVSSPFFTLLIFLLVTNFFQYIN